MSDMEPVWAPLERVALISRHHPGHFAFHEWEFMYMYARPEDGPYRVHAYKHRDTRKYIHLREGAGTSELCHVDELAAAIAALGFHDFEASPPRYRSCPPEQWPADDVDVVAAVLRRIAVTPGNRQGVGTSDGAHDAPTGLVSTNGHARRGESAL